MKAKRAGAAAAAPEAKWVNRGDVEKKRQEDYLAEQKKAEEESHQRE